MFEAVERYLVAAKVAQNVVSIDQPRRNGASIDYRVRFNVFSTDKKRVSVRFPVMIKNFGNDTQCLSLDELTRALSLNYRNKHVSIMWSLPSGITSTVYVSVKADGEISDCYTHHALWFVMEGN